MILTVGTDDGLREQAERALRGTQWATTVGNVASTAEAQDVIRGTAPPRVVIVGRSLGVAGGAEVAATAATLRTPPLVLLVAMPTTEVLRSAMRAGIRDVLPLDFGPEDLETTLRDAAVTGEGPAALPGLTVAVFSTKGGVGTSVVASNLAVLLGAQVEEPAVLLDLDLASADQAIMHGLSPRWTIQDLADGAVGVDAESLEQVLLPIDGSNSRLLAGPIDPALSETISSADVNAVIAGVRAQSRVVVLDTASGFDERTLSVLDVADVTVLVTSLDVAALRSLTVSLQTMERLGMDPASILVVLVRSDSKSGLSIPDVERAISRRIAVGVPSTRQVARSVNEGVPLAVSSPRSTVVSALQQLADLLAERLPDGVAVSKRAGSGLFSWSPPWGSSPSQEVSEGDAQQDPQSDDPRSEVRSVDVPEQQSDAGSMDEESQEQAPDPPKVEGDAKVRPLRVRRVRKDEGNEENPARDEADRGDPRPDIRAVPSLGDLPPPQVATEDDDEPRKRRRR